MHILQVVGARPNFMKAAPVMHALAKREGVRQTLVHTGQHYDADMSDVFFQQLDMPQPDFNLGVGSGSHAQQTAEVMRLFEPVILDGKPDMVLVYGDVNSTVAVTLVCAKLGVPVAHVEAGLRSFDRSMPEEINRLVTDQLADILFTPSIDGDENLAHEGIPKGKIRLVGNIMIDSLVRLLPKADESTAAKKCTSGLGRYGLVTLHRPSNVDDTDALRPIVDALCSISRSIPLVFPVHPRTRQQLKGLISKSDEEHFRLVDPLGYVDFLALQKSATLVITDSGGIQEETTYLGVPCLTVRENTERPVTVSIGTNVLVGQDMARLEKEVETILSGEGKTGKIPDLWDGRTAERIADELLAWKDRAGSMSLGS